MKWPWRDGGYHMKVFGDYAVTKHEMQPGEWEYLAWTGMETTLAATTIGSFDSFAEAETACVSHSQQ